VRAELIIGDAALLERKRKDKVVNGKNQNVFDFVKFN